MVGTADCHGWVGLDFGSLECVLGLDSWCASGVVCWMLGLVSL